MGAGVNGRDLALGALAGLAVAGTLARHGSRDHPLSHEVRRRPHLDRVPDRSSRLRPRRVRPTIPEEPRLKPNSLDGWHVTSAQDERPPWRGVDAKAKEE